MQEKFRERSIPIPASVEAELVSREKVHTSASTYALEEQTSAEETEQVERIAATQSLQPWQRSLSFSLGKLAGSGKPPSCKQAMHGEKIIGEARSLGFRG